MISLATLVTLAQFGLVGLNAVLLIMLLRYTRRMKRLNAALFAACLNAHELRMMRGFAITSYLFNDDKPIRPSQEPRIRR
jgi:hypothetical protein